jgi:hypothetical protein
VELLKLFLKFFNLIDELVVLFDDFLLLFLVDPIFYGVIGSKRTTGDGTSASNFVKFLHFVFKILNIFEEFVFDEFMQQILWFIGPYEFVVFFHQLIILGLFILHLGFCLADFLVHIHQFGDFVLMLADLGT